MSVVKFLGDAPYVDAYAFAYVAPGATALRRPSQVGFGQDGDYWYGLRVTSRPAPIQVDCYQGLQDKSYILDPAGIEFQLYGCLNPETDEPFSDGYSVLITSPQQIDFTSTPSQVATFTILETPYLRSSTLAQVLDGSSFVNSSIRSAFSNGISNQGAFILDSASSLPAGINLTPGGNLVASDASVVSPGVYSFRVNWIVDQGVDNSFDVRSSGSEMSFNHFVISADFRFAVLAPADESIFTLFSNQLATAQSTDSQVDWGAALVTFKLLSTEMRGAFMGTEWLNAAIAVEAYEADSTSIDNA